MPYTPDAPLTPHAPQTLPGTNTVVTRSFENRLLTAEFDDALVDQTPWKNPRYEGSKLKSKKLNELLNRMYEVLRTYQERKFL